MVSKIEKQPMTDQEIRQLALDVQGGRVFTSSASAGLMLMYEILQLTPSSRTPIVCAIANRAISGPINIHGEQTDQLLFRDSGWISIFSETNQEAHDQTFFQCASVFFPQVLDDPTVNKNIDTLTARNFVQHLHHLPFRPFFPKPQVRRRYIHSFPQLPVNAEYDEHYREVLIVHVQDPAPRDASGVDRFRRFYTLPVIHDVFPARNQC